ncbi:MAG: NHL repeat-containing protein [Usitatibacteraceae bacterium]
MRTCRFRKPGPAAAIFPLYMLVGLCGSLVSAQTITTVAGGGVGDGIAATAASLFAPRGVAVDSAGNVYIADSYHDRVRKLTRATGRLSTVSGTGVNGYNGDGIAATSAKLNRPLGVALDRSGNLYIADAGNNRIRKVSAASGIITTVAGTGLPAYNGDNISATDASLEPSSIVVDLLDNLFVADFGNNRIRRIDASTGVITTLAGTSGAGGYNGDNISATTAALYGPAGLAIDPAGNIYFADTLNQRVRKVAAGGGMITTVAGTGTYGFNGDEIPAKTANASNPRNVVIDAAGNLYFSEYERVRKVNAVTGIVTTVAGTGSFGLHNGDNILATMATLGSPSGIAIDGNGDLYIAEAGLVFTRNTVSMDGYGNRIRKLDGETGIITTLAGNGTPNFAGDGGNATGAVLNILANTPGVPYTSGVALDGAGNLYIADQNNHRVRKVTVATGTISTVAGSGSSGYNGDDIPAIGAALSYPTGVAVDAAGNLYIAERYGHRIRRVAAATGLITTFAGTGIAGYNGDKISATGAMLNGPFGIAVDSGGDLYIADTYNLRVRKVSASSGQIATIAGTGVPATISSGRPDFGYNGDDVLATGANLSQVVAIALDAMGNVYLADYDNNRVRKVIAATGIITNIAGTGNIEYNGDDIAAKIASLYAPSGIAFDSQGNLFIADAGHGRIRKITAGTGIISTSASAGASLLANSQSDEKLDALYGVAFDASNNLYVAGYNRIRRVSAAPPANYQGLWWSAPANSESGWGINVAHQANDIFATWFTYDAAGKALWLSMTANKIGPDYVGTLYQTRGPAFSAVPFNPAAVTRTAVGSGTLSFGDSGGARFSYILSGTAQTKEITRQVFGPLPSCVFGAQPNLALATNYQDLWWTAPRGSESGWGVNFTHQGDTVFATWFTYDNDGSPLWLSATLPKTGAGAYTGTLYRTTGPAFSAVPFLSANVARTAVGSLSLTFASGNDATFAYSLNGVTQSKLITRQVFNAPGTTCQ